MTACTKRPAHGVGAGSRLARCSLRPELFFGAVASCQIAPRSRLDRQPPSRQSAACSFKAGNKPQLRCGLFSQRVREFGLRWQPARQCEHQSQCALTVVGVARERAIRRRLAGRTSARLRRRTAAAGRSSGAGAPQPWCRRCDASAAASSVRAACSARAGGASAQWCELRSWCGLRSRCGLRSWCGRRCFDGLRGGDHRVLACDVEPDGTDSNSPGRITPGSAPMTARFASYHAGHAREMSTEVAPGPRWRAAMSHNVSPRRTT